MSVIGITVEDVIQTMIEILILFTLLSIKHFFADFVFQYDYMVQEKGYYGKIGGIHHSLIHGLGTWLIFWTFAYPLAFWVAVVDFLAHYHIDWAKMKIGRTKGYTPQDRAFWFWIGLDQLAHYLTYVVLIGWAVFTV